MIIIFSSFLFRIALIIYNNDLSILPGGQADAISFHNLGIQYSAYLKEVELFPETAWGNHRLNIKIASYSYFLGYIFKLVGTESFYFSGFLSCFAWFLSAIVFRKIMLKLKFGKKNINLAIIFYCFLFPTSIIYTSLTLREPYILLFINFIALSITNIYYEKEIKKLFLNIFFIFLASYLLHIFHVANLFFLIIFSSLIIIYYFINKFNIGTKTLIVLIILTVFFLSNFGSTEFIFDNIKKYQLGHFYSIQDRAAYYTKGEVENLNYDLISFFILICKNAFNYFVQPTISNFNNVKDILLICENILRIVFLFFILRKILLKFNSKIIFIIFLTMFLVMEMIFAQVTVNWGTASRHHVPVMGIFILLVFFPIKKIK
tara:strand:- start:701 stop:1825 length:1125 start_codon:yes stop_codon:yes gene_type:complete